MAPDDMGTTGSSGMPDMNQAAAKLKGATGADRMLLVAGLLFFIDSFLPWYGISFSFGEFGGTSVSIKGWSAGGLAVIAILLGIALTAFAAARVVGMTAPIGNLKDGMVYLVLGGGAFVFTLLRFVTQTRLTKYGLYLALVLTAVMAYGAWMKNQSQA